MPKGYDLAGNYTSVTLNGARQLLLGAQLQNLLEDEGKQRPDIFNVTHRAVYVIKPVSPDKVLKGYNDAVKQRDEYISLFAKVSVIIHPGPSSARGTSFDRRIHQWYCADSNRLCRLCFSGRGDHPVSNLPGNLPATNRTNPLPCERRVYSSGARYRHCR